MSKTKQYMFDVGHYTTFVEGDGRGLRRAPINKLEDLIPLVQETIDYTEEEAIGFIFKAVIDKLACMKQ